MDHLETEARNIASTDLDQLTALQIAQLMNAEDAKVIPAVASQFAAIAQAIEVIASRSAPGGRLMYAGAGTSGPTGRARRGRVSADVQFAAGASRRRHCRRAGRLDQGG